MKSTIKWEISILALLFTLVVVFAVQNAAEVGIKLLLWEVTLPRSQLIFLVLLVGIAIGWVLRSVIRIARKSHRVRTD